MKQKVHEIRRKIWLNWSSGGASMLYRPIDGLMCPVGQVCHQIGIAKKWLNHVFSPSDILKDAPRWERLPRSLLDELGGTLSIFDLNDTQLRKWETPARREKKIIESFAKLGILVKFAP